MPAGLFYMGLMGMDQEYLLKEEDRRIRLLRISTDLLIQTIMTQPLTVEEVEKMIRGLRGMAERLFPGSGRVFDLIYVPRFRRAMRESGIGDHRDALRVVD